jgi:hypothetical protein
MTSPGSLAIRLAEATRLGRRVRRRIRGHGERRTIVTGANSSHAACQLNLLRSLELSHVSAEVIVYDLGMTPAERARVAAFRGVSLRTFAFAAHPPHVDIDVAAGEYAWKPILISDVARARGGLILWLDAGDLVFGDLRWTWRVIEREGVYSPTSSGTVRDWTHPATLAALGGGPELLDLRNRNAALVGFDTRQTGAGQVLEAWRDAALDPGIIAPSGSDRSNHRQDQAVLTVLYYQAQARLGFKVIQRKGDVAIHQDDVPPAELVVTLDRLRARSRGADVSGGHPAGSPSP